MKLKAIYDAVQALAPFETQLSFDNAGLLIGSMDDEIHKVGIALDATPSSIEQAKAAGCDLLLTHHPVVFQPLSALTMNTPAALCIAAGIRVLSAHTNADRAAGGVNDALASALGMDEVRPLGELARMGTLCFETAEQAAHFLKQKLSCAVRYVDAGKPIRTAAVCGGAGGDCIARAKNAGCDALITGECKHHERLEAAAIGLSLFECGHYHTEKWIKPVFADWIRPLGLPVEILKEDDPAVYC